MRRLFLGLGLVLLASACGEPGAGSADDAAARRADPSADRADAPAAERPDTVPLILFLGNSLTAGYGIGPDSAFPAIVQAKLDSVGYRYGVINAGVSGETSAGGVRRVDWLLRRPVAVLVLELGANDMLRGQDLAQTRRNLQEIIDRVREKSPGVAVVIAGMEAPPNLGPRYTAEYRRLYRDLARENDAVLIPFLLEGVAAVPALNQADGIHPNAAGHRIVAETVWRALEPVLRRRAPA